MIKAIFLKKTMSALLITSVLLGSGGCVSASQTQEMQTQIPEVALITAAPVITITDVVALPFPDSGTVPQGYSRVPSEEASDSLFAFTDNEGNVQYRVFGGYSELTDGVETQSFTGFYPCDETGAILPGDDGFVDDSAESLGICEPAALPETLRMKNAYHALETTGFYADESGDIIVYGTVGDAEAAFYPALAEGMALAGALPLMETVTVPSYLPETVPTKDGERMLVVYIGTQTVVCYVAEDGEWIETRVMICSTGRRADMTPRGTFSLVRQYLYKKMGQVDGENVYSQYASRITGSYLFHSVPIGGEKRYSPEYGKRQMFIKYYERLGTPASGGCVRLRCIDAYWVYMNCDVGDTIIVTDDNGPEAPEIPALIYEEPYMDNKHEYGWDPSDPDPENPYHAVYTPEVVLDGLVIDKSVDDGIEDTSN